MDLIYLHGFASGPQGAKGSHCRDWCGARNIPFHAPDLNLPDFEHLTLTAQVAALAALVRGLAEPPVVVGSSMGGLVAAAAAHQGVPMAWLILLAPAFGFARRRLAGPRWAGYRRRGSMRTYHHAQAKWLTLGPELLADLPRWQDDQQWRLTVPVAILHGRQDEAVPLAESEAFAARHPGAVLQVLEDDHGLLAPDSLAALDVLLAGAFSQLAGYTPRMEFEWDPEKAVGNIAKHGVGFMDASTLFGDPFELTLSDPAHSGDEFRFISLGRSSTGRLLVVSYTERGARIRIISAREATPRERRQYESKQA